ncbi:MAG: hypothetical protein AWU56_2543 [Idiomarina sp. T82-3]|uniref:hypothetical protein n=1 Tax=Idiomarina TaxID=135575 RepID=UPI00079AA763|nr:hypothetical protein [Idiomarina sp. T82-3]KXS33892.1 MAG: hypothetical protein AWU56_2543 [Idiomarina sp. T82-3]
MDVWLERLKRFLEIIRPKTYNVIARLLVFTGLTIVVESQLNLFQAILIYLCELFFGKADILIELFRGSSTPWLGFSLIVIGVVYHSAITIGKDLVEAQLQAKKAKPELEMKLLNVDMEEFKKNVIRLRGVLAELPDAKDIPTLEAPAHYETMYHLSGIAGLNHGERLHPDFFHHRSNYLKTWGGAELLTLKLKNSSSTKATGVSVEIKLEKKKGLSVDNTRESVPHSPKRKKPSLLEETMRFDSPPTQFDITQDHTYNEYTFLWEPNDIQAGAQTSSDTFIFLKSSIVSRIELTIFCDQFETPKKIVYDIIPPNEIRNITLSELQYDDEEFDKLANELIMDGYFDREFERMSLRFEHQAEETLP